MKKYQIKLGLIGWDGRGGRVAREGYDATGGMILPVACVEPSDERYLKACKSFEFEPRRYRTVKEMLSKEALDCTMIATPNQFHLENLQDLKGTGMPVLLEKPLDSSFERICDVVRFAATYDGPIL